MRLFRPSQCQKCLTNKSLDAPDCSLGFCISGLGLSTSISVDLCNERRGSNEDARVLSLAAFAADRRVNRGMTGRQDKKRSGSEAKYLLKEGYWYMEPRIGTSPFMIKAGGEVLH